MALARSIATKKPTSYYDAYKADESDEQEARAAAERLVGERASSVEGVRARASGDPGWNRFFDNIEVNNIANQLRGGPGARLGGGFGNATSFKRGGVTVARSSGGGDRAYGEYDDGAMGSLQEAAMRPAWARVGAGTPAQDRAVRDAEALDTDDADLYTGRAAARANKMAEVAGDADVVKYNRQQPIRDAKRFEQRSIDRERGYEDPAVKRAEIEADARRREESSNTQKARAAAMAAFAKLAQTATTTPPELEEDDPTTGTNLGPLGVWGRRKRQKPNPAFQSLQDAMEELRGQIDPAAGGGQGGAAQEISMADVEAVARQQGWTTEQAMAEAERRGYAVR